MIHKFKNGDKVIFSARNARFKGKVTRCWQNTPSIHKDGQQIPQPDQPCYDIDLFDFPGRDSMQGAPESFLELDTE